MYIYIGCLRLWSLHCLSLSLSLSLSVCVRVFEYTHTFAESFRLLSLKRLQSPDKLDYTQRR